MNKFYKVLFLLLIIPLFTLGSYYYSAVDGGGGGECYFFLETWDGSTEDNSWTAYGGNSFNDDYTATILEGTQSAWMDLAGATEYFIQNVTAFSDDSSSAVYARYKFRVTETGSTTTGPALFIRLLDSGKSAVVESYLYWHTGGFYRIYTSDGTASYTGFTDNTFSDATYIYQIAYGKGSGVSGSIRNSSNVEVYSKVIATSKTDDIAFIEIRNGESVDVIIDSVEIRPDENWGE